MDGIYKVNLIASDLSMEETILQIADTLDNLNGIVDDVFSRILTRIQQNMQRTSILNERIDTSRAKVDKLTGMQKAIKVFSSAKYPASIKHEHYRSVFDLNGYKHEPKQITLSGKTQGLSNEKSLQEKLHFYHVKVAELNAPKSKDFNLSAVIDTVESISELLVFNTNESPYLGTLSKTHAFVPPVSSKVISKSLLEDAPSSIMKRDVLKRETDEYMYAPGIGMVPELEMPLDLPNLAGIAGDVQFSITTDGSIAPSVVTSPVAPSVPECELPEFPELSLPELSLPDVKPKSDDKVALERSDMPDAPPAIAVSVQSLPPLPPPPPPPPPPMETEPLEVKRQGKAQQAAPAPVGDAHSNLMEAIRNAGGAGRAKLRSAADNTSEKATPSTGDLMADLHAKLSMRRRGISGAERSGGSVLHTLASVIPEPESTSQRSSSDEDWE